MATRENNTMAEGLSKINHQIADMKLMPDADMPFLISLETDILNYLKPPQPAQPGAAPGGGPGGPPGAPGGPMGAAMGQVMGGGPGPALGGPGGGQAGMPNPDEMRRLVGQ